MRKNKTVAAIATFLILTFAVSLAAIPAANAHYPGWELPTFAHIYAATNPIGVGQTAYIYIFLTPTYADTNIENDYRFHNYQLVITDPDGEETTLTYETVWDTTSNQFASFTPDKVGTYDLTFNFPGQAINDYPHNPNSQYVNDTYAASSASTTLTVQEDPISHLPLTPLPTEFWTRPIFGQNSLWWAVSSNWLGSGMPGYGAMNGPNQRDFAPDAIGSKTAHIMWTVPNGQIGGVVGGDLSNVQGDTWFEGTAYSQRYVNPIIVNGRIYYQEPLGPTGSAGFFGGAAGPTVCRDLVTGQEIWRRSDVPALSFAYIQDMDTPDYHGVRPPMLVASVGGGWGGGPSSWQVYDAATGDLLFNVDDIPSGTTVIGPMGEVIKYSFYNNGTTQDDYYLCQWNSSRIWSQGIMGALTLMTDRTTGNVPASSSFMYDTLNPATQNQSISWRNDMSSSPSIVGAIYGDVLLCRNGSYPGLGDNSQNPYTYFAVNLNASKGIVGSVLWWHNVDPPADNITTISFAGLDAAGYFCESYRQTQQFVFYNLRTGAHIKTADPQAALDYYGSNGPGSISNVIAYGRCYSSAYSGILYCYDMSTGEVLWTYGNGGVPGNDTYSGFQVPGPYPTFINALGDDVVYLVTSEHTFQTPIYKGALIRAVNATDGTEIWTLPSATGEFFGISVAIADGYTNFFNSYDHQIYTLGRGPSATTVTVGPKSSTFGTSVVVEGAVTDLSAGTKQTEQAARFPDGVPVSSDESMTDWMSYVYQQQPLPSDFKGVNVTLSVLDSNDNWYEIGTATSDANGFFHYTWTPIISGDFTVYATFAGSEGYWPSQAVSAFTVTEAPEATPPPTPSPAPMTDAYVLGTGITAIIAIIIIGLVIILMLRKR